MPEKFRILQNSNRGICKLQYFEVHSKNNEAASLNWEIVKIPDNSATKTTVLAQMRYVPNIQNADICSKYVAVKTEKDTG